jgi:uncharacterized damage-inducible protein DinB
MTDQLQEFISAWTKETDATLALLRALPSDSYDVRPDAGGRSIGELAWHLAEIDAYISLGIERRSFKFDGKPPHLDRPRRIDELAPALRIVHDDALARLTGLEEGDLGDEIPYADGHSWSIRNLLWNKLLLHHVHHRGQLMLLCRLAGGVPPALFGRRREETLRQPVRA